MTKNKLASRVRVIIHDHKSDHDGGYGAIAAISDFQAHLDPSDKFLLQKYLLEVVSKDDTNLWGIALEVLTRTGGKEVAETLEQLVRSKEQDEEGKKQLILALLRMGHDALDIYLPHIQSLLLNKKPACAELAHLYRVSPDLSIKMSASLLAGELAKKDGLRRAEYCMPVFIYNYPKEDEKSLAALVSELHKIDPTAANKLRDIIRAYLSGPLFIKYLGPEKIDRVLSYLGQ